uniref:Uncharacterized protein n=1 Tax=Meloidogyne javanica TaxID=6303 RepID=A0A915MBF0_MELJA
MESLATELSARLSVLGVVRLIDGSVKFIKIVSGSIDELNIVGNVVELELLNIVVSVGIFVELIVSVISFNVVSVFGCCSVNILVDVVSKSNKFIAGVVVDGNNNVKFDELIIDGCVEEIGIVAGIVGILEVLFVGSSIASVVVVVEMF